ncbi:hypothetical protein DVH24_016432 [Malus domestica]|uniref:hydroxymethylglutaryl-CoA lyase n=1 Tax=Malus domestica TaxID=3750 RepID=A0A498HS94_MALDO|nr:hypothetical protein DVH24_016432 [Malus domestica]
MAAIASGAKEVGIFASASQSFSKSNINCSIEDSLVCHSDVAIAARKLLIPLCGYISCVVGCPVEGKISPSQVAYVAKELYDMGCSEISLGDTIGVGTPVSFQCLRLLLVWSPLKLAVHFHDTYGQAISNILASLQVIHTALEFSRKIKPNESSQWIHQYQVLGVVRMLKEGASGNVATEDVVYMLNGLGLKTHVDLKKLMLAGDFICKHLGRSSGSKTTVALRKVTAPAPKL